VFELILPDGEKLWTPALRRMDEILDDEGLVSIVEEALAHRRSKSRCWGRPGTPAEVVLRMLLLKHLHDWTFDECEAEVRGNLLYRAFCRIGCERVPDAKTLIRLAAVLEADVLKRMLARLVQVAVELGLVRGTKLRVDTTVVETNVHYPTDSTLLADGVRVLTRAMRQMGVRFRDRTRSVAKRVYEISQLGRKLLQEPARRRMQSRYRELMALTRAVVRQAEAAARKTARTAARAAGAPAIRLQALRRRIKDTVILVRRVLAQTRARVLKGDTHYKDKLLSLFETHTEAIRKGKAAKPTEFGKLVKIQEAERFVTDYEVCATRIPDQELWLPALEIHERLFARPPRLATADAGFASQRNERVAREMGVRRVVLPIQGKAHPRQRWFRNGLRWRTGCEGRISTLKRRHGLRRCRYRGPDGMQRWVGLGVIADDLELIGRALSSNS